MLRRLIDKYGIAIAIGVACGSVIGGIFSWLENAEARDRARFMASCESENKEYACILLWDHHDRFH